MDMYASVLRRALGSGKRVAEGVHLYIQFGSAGHPALRGGAGLHRRVRARRRRARRPVVRRVHQGRAGRLDAARRGDGVRHQPHFPGRSGPGKVYLASPLVVAASAIAGRIVSTRRRFSTLLGGSLPEYLSRAFDSSIPPYLREGSNSYRPRPEALRGAFRTRGEWGTFFRAPRRGKRGQQRQGSKKARLPKTDKRKQSRDFENRC